jgi:hypothetical protein
MFTTAHYFSLCRAGWIQFQVLPSYSCNLCTPRSSTWPLSFWLPHQKPECISLSSICATCPVHLTFHDFITLIIFGEEDKSQSFSWSNFLQLPVTSSLLGLAPYLEIPTSHVLPLMWDTNVLYSIITVYFSQLLLSHQLNALFIVHSVGDLTISEIPSFTPV